MRSGSAPMTRYLPLTTRVGVPSTPERWMNCAARLSFASVPKLCMVAANSSASALEWAAYQAPISSGVAFLIGNARSRCSAPNIASWVSSRTPSASAA